MKNEKKKGTTVGCPSRRMYRGGKARKGAGGCIGVGKYKRCEKIGMLNLLLFLLEHSEKEKTG